MGGHGGLNILPQKRWNVYNFDNREKVKKDEEEAAKQEQIKREQSRKRDTEYRLEQLRQARGLASASRQSTTAAAEAEPAPSPEAEVQPKSKHMNLFEGIKIFDPIEIVDKNKGELGDEKRKGFKRMKKEAETQKVVLPEDEKYRLGYGVAGKGVKLPWYIEKRPNLDANTVDNDNDCDSETPSRIVRKKSVEELREERLKREGREKDRERALMARKGRPQVIAQNDRGYSRRR